MDLDKKTLRQRMLARRRELEAKEQKNALIAHRLQNLPAFKKARGIMFYHSLPDEVQTKGLLEEAWRAGKRVALPHTHRQLWQLIPGWVRGEDDLVAGVWGIKEPDPSRLRWVYLGDLDLVIVPGLAFDRRGYRIGYGGGFYDRFLARLPDETLKIGLAFQEQVVEKVPTEEYDQPLDMLITDAELIDFRS
ncbi:MAG: 5-formyltetrahydrofolate cyclo-ligase [Limnochordia bacterium]|jgi:5-formyltetrahydrofolate cyclo-ligase